MMEFGLLVTVRTLPAAPNLTWPLTTTGPVGFAKTGSDAKHAATAKATSLGRIRSL
jgi:hypothetical protein